MRVANNNFTKSFYYQDLATNNSIVNNRFSGDLGYATLVMLVSRNGSNNIIQNNTINGYGVGQGGIPLCLTINGQGDCSPNTNGSQSDILLRNESGDLVYGNNVSNGWNCGIEINGLLKNSVISNNSVNGGGFCGIGGWYWINIQNDTFSWNNVTNSSNLFYFIRVGSLLPGENYVYFTNNYFLNNNQSNYSSYSTGVTWITMNDSFFGDVDSNDFIASNNTFTNNNFGPSHWNFNGTQQFPIGPILDPVSAMVNGGGNICGIGYYDGPDGNPLNCTMNWPGNST